MTWPTEPFVVGANLPWVDYGCDFGANAWFPEGGLGARPDALAGFERAMDRLATDRLSLARLFMLCDGRAGIRFDAGGLPLGLDDAFFRDVDAALASAFARGIGLMPVLFDFHLCDAPQILSGVRLGGRHALLTDDEGFEALVAQVVSPIVERYGDHPGVAGWDLFNEPEWCTSNVGAGLGSRWVSFRRMRQRLGALSDRVHRYARQPVTVGLAGTARLDLVRDLGLDFYQVHWYEPFGRAALAEPVSRLGLDRPVILGEFPGLGSEVTPTEIVLTAHRAGYSGALVWSMLARDAVSAYAEGLADAIPSSASPP